MKIGVLIDATTRKYAGDALEGDPIPEGYELVTDPLSDGMYDPAYVDGEWVGKTRQEYEADNPSSELPPTPEERIAQLEADNLTLMEVAADLYEMILSMQTGGAVE